MHDIEPHFKWRDKYNSSKDDKSPFYGKVYDEFRYTQKIYNYFIHPQWDQIGSPTLYIKQLHTDYEEGYVILELIGEWNDAITNDIMFLKREIIDAISLNGINKYILLCEHVLNFHGSDDCYYEEWYEDVVEEEGWICFVNTLEHVKDEMQQTRLQHYVNFGDHLNDINWRTLKPNMLYSMVESIIQNGVKQLTY